MRVRLRAALGVAACLIVATSCGTGGSAKAPTTSLPLQSAGLAVGGDVQSRATDVIEVGITEEQAKQIAKACDKTVEVASGRQVCAEALREASASANPCEPSAVCLRFLDVSQVPGAGRDAIIEIVDNRPGQTQCNSASGRVCLRVGVATSALLNQIVATTAHATSSEAPTSTSPETSPTAPSETTAPTAPSETTAPPTSASPPATSQ
jgi:hypothetical protein